MNHDDSNISFPSGQNLGALEKKVYDLHNLIELGMSLSSNLDFQSLVESILYSCIGQMFVEKVSIILQVDIDVNNYYIHMAKGYDEEFDPTMIVLNEDDAVISYFEKNPTPHRYALLRENQAFREEMTALERLEPEIVVPMKSKDAINGIIVLGSKIGGGDFSQDEHEFLRDLARFAAIAVENSRLYLMATLDRMTRLYIHHYFQERLFEEIKRSQRYETPLSLLISDIDHFKKFNDTYGHQQGDIVLKETARIFRESLRRTDVPARYGGEEFAAILPETELENAAKVANRLRRRIEEHAFPGQEETLHVTVSVGVAQFDITRDSNKESLIKRADRALYKAKETGRNRIIALR